MWCLTNLHCSSFYYSPLRLKNRQSEARVAANPKVTALGLPKKLPVPVEIYQVHLLPQKILSWNKKLQQLLLNKKMTKKPGNSPNSRSFLGWAILNALFICRGLWNGPFCDLAHMFICFYIVALECEKEKETLASYGSPLHYIL